jgi:hypothetical protein
MRPAGAAGQPIDGLDKPRIAWFSGLESLQGQLDLLQMLQDEMGLTTLVPESHLCHTSGFAPSPQVVEASPVEGWRASPTLRLHRDLFGIQEPAFAVLPGVVSGFDDAPLLRLIEECRRLGLEVWGHAGLWSYGGEVFPELAVRDLFGRPLPGSSVPWGIPFCPSKPALHEWIKRSLVDVVRRYDLDGMFLDHARYPSPGDVPSLLACGCSDCEEWAAAWGYDFDACRSGLRALRETLGAVKPNKSLSGNWHSICWVRCSANGAKGRSGWQRTQQWTTGGASQTSCGSASSRCCPPRRRTRKGASHGSPRAR